MIAASFDGWTIALHWQAKIQAFSLSSSPSDSEARGNHETNTAKLIKIYWILHILSNIVWFEYGSSLSVHFSGIELWLVPRTPSNCCFSSGSGLWIHQSSLQEQEDWIIRIWPHNSINVDLTGFRRWDGWNRMHQINHFVVSP